MAFDMKDYVEVADRIREWYAKFPDGRIVPDCIENGETRVTMRAAVYRTSDPLEQPAGVGHSALLIPGKTPYTKDSELENAETSAVGRALVMAGIPSKHVASAGEVRSKSDAGAAPPSGREASRPAQKATPPAPASSGASRSGGGGATQAATGKRGSETPTPARTKAPENPWEGMEGMLA
jgi:hypothetical protein